MRRQGRWTSWRSCCTSTRAARYRATEYIKEEARSKPEYRDLFRAGDRIARLMGVLLLKRLESSIEAFRSTLRSLMTSNRNFREALDAGFVPIGSTATRLLAGQSFDVDDLLEVLRQEEQRRQQAGAARDKLVHGGTDFDTDRWTLDLDADYDVLKDILGRVEDIGPEDDDKLRALRDFLARPEVQAGKVLIFSEARDDGGVSLQGAESQWAAGRHRASNRQHKSRCREDREAVLSNVEPLETGDFARP